MRFLTGLCGMNYLSTFVSHLVAVFRIDIINCRSEVPFGLIINVTMGGITRYIIVGWAGIIPSQFPAGLCIQFGNGTFICVGNPDYGKNSGSMFRQLKLIVYIIMVHIKELAFVKVSTAGIDTRSLAEHRNRTQRRI